MSDLKMIHIRERGCLKIRRLPLSPAIQVQQHKDENGIWSDIYTDVQVSIGRWERREPTEEERELWTKAKESYHG